MSERFHKILRLSPENYYEHIVTPIAPYFICDHYFATEIYPDNEKYVCISFGLRGNDLYKHRNYGQIKDYDIVQVQVDLFEEFMIDILPKINRKIVLITSQMHLPQIRKTEYTDICLRSDKIVLWVSQNPIYNNHPKYMPFPYGIHYDNVNDYMNYIKNLCPGTLEERHKKRYVYNGPITLHAHLSENHIRRDPYFADVIDLKLSYIDFLSNIAKSKFALSLSGDRDDCYRHYECIGLNTIPISDIDNAYMCIFANSMVYTNLDGIRMIMDGRIMLMYDKPNRDILTIDYWKDEIMKKVRVLK